MSSSREVSVVRCAPRADRQLTRLAKDEDEKSRRRWASRALGITSRAVHIVQRSLYVLGEGLVRVRHAREADMAEPLSIPELAEAQRRFLATLHEPMTDAEYAE